MKRRASLRKRQPRHPRRKVTGYFGWRFGDGFLLRGTARQYELLMARGTNLRIDHFMV